MRRLDRLVALVLTLALTGVACHTVAPRPPETREGMIDVPGGRVWYRIVGADRPGVPLLVLHGGPGIPHDYLTPLEALADERPVVFYDQLGCGGSDRTTDESLWTIEHFTDELARVRDALHLDRVHVLGHSWGTMLATDYMLNAHPSGVVSLTFVGSALSMSRWVADQRAWLTELPAEMQQAVHDAEASGDYESQAYQAAVGAYYGQHVCRVDPWPDYVTRALAPDRMNEDLYRYMDGPSEFEITGTLRDYERVGRLAEIHTPTLFVCGRYDEATPAATEFYHRNMPGSEMAVLEDASHLCFVERPAAFQRVVRRFLARVERAR